MSSREKVAWASLLSTLAVWVPYFAFSLTRIRPESPGAGSIVGAFVGAVIVQALISIVAGVAIRQTSVEELKDERDVAVEARALKIAYYVLIVSIFFVIGLSGYVADSVATSPIKGVAVVLLISQLSLLCIITAEATRFLAQVVYYRRGV